MAATLPVLGLTSALKPLRTSLASIPLSNSLPLPSPCRIPFTETTRALRRESTASNSIKTNTASGKTVDSGRELLGRASSALAFAGSLLTASASLADEEGIPAALDGSDVGISNTVSVLFVAATVGLVVLTGGVVYLGLTEFLEKRALQEEQKKVVAQEAKPKKSSKQAVRAAAREGGPKGFGSSKRSKGDGESSGGSE